MARILVTGAAGFIGFHLSKRLLEMGHKVVGLDNFSDYYDVILKHNRVAILREFSGFTLAQGDLADLQFVDETFRSGSFTHVCNLAAQAGVRHSLTHPHSYVTSNLVGFVNILECCRHQGKPKLVYASSSSVYGGNTEMPFDESQRVDTPISLYAASKKSNELMAHAYSHLYSMQTIGLRFFTVYGPWGRPDMAMWLFADAMLDGRPFKVFNHGNMKRDFTYIDDIVNGICGALFAEDLPAYEVFNLGNHRCEKLMDVITILSEALQVEPKMEMLPMQPGDVPASFAAVEKARQMLGFEPTTGIQQGIPRFAEWYLDYRKQL